MTNLRAFPLALAALALTACQPSATTTVDTSNQAGGDRILFQTLDTLIAQVRPDGSDVVTPYAEVSTLQTNPDWDPTGTRVTFVAAGPDGTEDLWIGDGPEASLLLDCTKPCLYLDDPAWSKDGTRVAYSRMSDIKGVGVGTLETVDVETGEVTVLLGPWENDFTAGVRWSPDSESVVFEKVHKVAKPLDADVDGVVLTTLDLASGKLTALTDPLVFAATADWAPDGARIVYSALAKAGDEAPDLFSIEPNGAGLRQITDLAEAGGYAAEPTYASDSRTIVFSGSVDGAESDVLLKVSAADGVISSATGEATTYGRHPRLQPAP